MRRMPGRSLLACLCLLLFGAAPALAGDNHSSDPYQQQRDKCKAEFLELQRENMQMLEAAFDHSKPWSRLLPQKGAVFFESLREGAWFLQSDDPPHDGDGEAGVRSYLAQFLERTSEESRFERLAEGIGRFAEIGNLSGDARKEWLGSPFRGLWYETSLVSEWIDRKTHFITTADPFGSAVPTALEHAVENCVERGASNNSWAHAEDPSFDRGGRILSDSW